MSNFHATMNGKNVPTKKALREAVLAGTIVFFADTSAFNNRGTLLADQLGPGDVVVGPDPYRDRRWYANVKKSVSGKLSVV